MTSVAESWRALRAAPLERQCYVGALGIALALGSFLRLKGYVGGQISFWLDEAQWAPRFVNWPLLSLGIRPIGFVWLTRQIVGLLGPSEVWFRLLPNLGGVLSLWMMPYVASRLLASRALRVLLVLFFALHPALVDLAKEFKPYSFEVFVHLLLVVLYLRYEQTGRRGFLFALLAGLPIAFLLAYNVAFALPGLLLLALFSALQGRRWRLLAACVLSGAVCGAAIICVNELALTKVNQSDKTESYWGQKYDVFYGHSETQGRAKWTLEKTRDMTAMIGLRRDLWSTSGRISEPVAEKLGAVESWLWVALGAAGVVALARQRRAQLLLWLLPLVALGVVNALGKWPLGAFRTNLFTCVYLFPLPFLGADLLVSLARRALGAPLVLLLAADALLGLTCGVDWQGRKRTWCQDGYSREVIQAVYELRKQQLAAQPTRRRARLVLDLYSHKAFDYYLGLHPTFSRNYADFSKLFAIDKVSSNQLVSRATFRLQRPGTVYVVAAKRTSARALTTFAESGVRVVKEKRIANNVLILVLER